MRLEVAALCACLAAAALACGSDCASTCSDVVGLSAQASAAILGAASAKLCQNSTCVSAVTTFAVNEPAARFTGAITASMGTSATHAVGVSIDTPATEWHDGDVWSLEVYAQNGTTLLSVSAGPVQYRRLVVCGTHCVQMTIPMQ